MKRILSDFANLDIANKKHKREPPKKLIHNFKKCALDTTKETFTLNEVIEIVNKRDNFFLKNISKVIDINDTSKDYFNSLLKSESSQLN